MKKFYGILILTVALLVVGSYDNRAEAYDNYMGTWRSGYDAYLMTETIESGIVSNAQHYWCTVKAVKGSHVMYIDYEFYWTHSEWRFSNSDGVDNAVKTGTSIEKNIMRFIAPKARIY